MNKNIPLDKLEMLNSVIFVVAGVTSCHHVKLSKKQISDYSQYSAYTADTSPTAADYPENYMQKKI